MAKRFVRALTAKNPHAIAEGMAHAGQFVTQVTEETRKGIHDVIVRSVSEGIPPRKAAKMIQPMLGLTSKQAQAVLKLGARLEAGGASPEFALARSSKYADQLLAKRSLLIARTEIMRAQNAGQKAAWKTGSNAGLIAAQSQKVWLVADDDRLCPLCKQMEDVAVTLDEPFNTPRGKMDMPPMHPNCRCTAGLRPPEIVRGPSTAQQAARVLAKQQAQADAAAAAAKAAEDAAAAELAAKLAAEQAAAKAAKAAIRKARRAVGTTDWLDDMLTRRIGQQLGTNPGGMFQDARGTKWYVKQYANEEQAWSEAVSNKVYRDLGIDVPKATKVQRASDGKTYFASQIAENQGTVGSFGMTAKDAKQILNGFSADVLTANWDAVGTGLDNVVKSGKKILRIDMGGTLKFRAQGALKPSSVFNSIGEWETFVSHNQYYRQVFQNAGLSNANELGAQAIAQIDKIEAVAKKYGGDWEKLVKKALKRSGASKSFVRETAQLLESRAQLLYAKRAELQTLAGAPRATASQVAQRSPASWPIDDHVHRFIGNNFPLTMERRANEALRELNADAKSAIKSYTGSSYGETNARLWKNPNDLMGWEKDMQRALETSKATPPELVWRGARRDTVDGGRRFSDLKPGDMIQLNGFQSTSIDPQFAHNWASDVHRGQTLLEIKPARGLYVEPITRNSGEWEFILPHASRYRVVGRKTITIKDRWGGLIRREVIQLEMF